MPESVACPVPPEQRPLEEFRTTDPVLVLCLAGNGTGLT